MSRSPFVENPVVIDDVLHGTIAVPALDHVVEATFDPSSDDDDDEDNEDIDIDMVVEAAATIVAKLTTDAIAAIVDQVATEITDSAFSHMDVDDDHAATSLSALRAALRVARIDFWLDGALLVFVAPTIFVGQEIVVQLDEDLAVDDIAIHDA